MVKPPKQHKQNFLFFLPASFSEKINKTPVMKGGFCMWLLRIVEVLRKIKKRGAVSQWVQFWWSSGVCFAQREKGLICSGEREKEKAKREREVEGEGERESKRENGGLRRIR